MKDTSDQSPEEERMLHIYHRFAQKGEVLACSSSSRNPKESGSNGGSEVRTVQFMTQDE